MKKKYSFTLLSIVFSLTLVAQVNFAKPNKVVVPKPENQVNINKSVGCLDIIQYPQSKLTGTIEVDSLKMGYIEGITQAYHYNGNGSIHGVSVYLLLDLDGVPGNKDSISMIISVYTIIDIDINYPNKPQTLISTDTVDVFDVGFNEQLLMFSAPVSVNDSFAVVIELNQSKLPPFAPWYAFNSYGDGNQEKLAWAIYAGALYNAYTDWAGAWDVDMMLSPIFEDLVNPAYSVDTNAVCIGTPIQFTNNSAIVYNTMFNTGKPTFNLNLDELMAVVAFDSTYTHTYSSGGIFNTNFEIVQYGYTGNCIIDSITPVTVIDSASSNYTYSPLGGGSYQFTDASIFGTTYYWDFGDGDTSTTQNPVHTFLTANTFTVCLTVSNDSACVLSTFCQDVISTVGRKEIAVNNEIKIYPIPAKRFFTVELPGNFANAEISVTDIVGKNIISIDNLQQNKVKVVTEELNSGVYFVSVSSNGQKVFTKRIIVDK